MDEWIEIFKGGKREDSNGIERDADWLIDQAIKLFNPQYHEPPIVIGHPKTDDPAKGWVAGLRAEVIDGEKKLFYKPKDVEEAFAQDVNAGRWKKRSPAFYSNGMLKHVGYLGAVPPATKGMPDHKFSEADFVIFDFSDSELKNKGENKMSEKELTFTEADLEAAKKKAAEEAREKAQIEFAEKQRLIEKQARDKEIAAFVDAKIQAGAMLPAWRDLGLVKFMQSLDADGRIEFSENTETSPLEFMKLFLKSLEENPLFSEFATKTNAGDTGKSEADEDEELGRRIAARTKRGE